MFPHAAAANRSIFYDASGRARSIGEVYGKLTRLFDSARDVAVAQRGGIDGGSLAPISLAPPLPPPVTVGVAPVKSLPSERPIRTAAVGAAAGAACINSDAARIHSTARYGGRHASLRAGRGKAATTSAGPAVFPVDVHGSGQPASGADRQQPVGPSHERIIIADAGSEGVRPVHRHQAQRTQAFGRQGLISAPRAAYA